MEKTSCYRFALVVTLTLAFVTASYGQTHWKTVWSGTAYQPMNITVTMATVSGTDLYAGDEIAVIDNHECVGWAMMGPVPGRNFTIVTSMDNPATGEVDGFTPGDTITFRFWMNEFNEEWIVDQPTWSSGNGTFVAGGSAIVTLIAHIPTLSVVPSERSVSGTAGSTSFEVSNLGSWGFEWMAKSDAEWATITGDNGGIAPGTLQLAYTANPSTSSSRTATITFSAPGQRVLSSPQLVTITQAPAQSAIAQDVTVTFRVNMNGAKDYKTGQVISGLRGVYLAGDQLPLQWPQTDWTYPDTANGSLQKLYDDGLSAHGDQTAGDNIWSRVLTFKASDGVSPQVEYKFGAVYPGVDLNGPKYLDNENAVSANHVLTLDDKTGAMTVFNVFGSLGAQPVLLVDPDNQDVESSAGTTSFDVSNTGTGTMPWTASSDQTWATIPSGSAGTNSGTVTVNVTANTSAVWRVAKITVTGTGAAGSPRTVTVCQAPDHSTILKDVTVTFRVNMTGAKDFVSGQGISGLKGVYLAGDQLPLQWPQSDWTFPDTGNGSLLKLYDDGNPQHGDLAAGDSIWSTILTFKKSDGVPPRVEYKYGAVYPGVDQNGSHYLDNENGYSANHVLMLDDNTGSMTVLDVFGALGPQPVLSVLPKIRNVPTNGGSSTFSVTNSGTGTMAWSASSDQPWATITSGALGTNAGTITVAYTANGSTSDARTAAITVTASGAIGSAKSVTLEQASAGGMIARDVTVTFHVNMAGARDFVNGQVISGLTGVFLAGDQRPLQWPLLDWTFPDTSNGTLEKLYDDGNIAHGDLTAGDNIWSSIAIFRAADGVSPRVEYKYGAVYPGVDLNGPRYLDNEAAVSANHVLTLDDAYGVMSVSDKFGTVVTDVAQHPLPALPKGYELLQNYPNPFNPSTIIRYGLPQRAYVILTLFNALGQQMAELQRGEQGPGYHEVRVNCTGMASGVYFYRIRAGEFIQTRQLCVVK